MNQATKPSRQMAFQISALEYREALNLFAQLGDATVIKGYLDAVRDEAKRARLSGALQIGIKCSKDGTDPRRVRRIICWRGPDGKPGVLEAEISKTA